jgi:hypothetical protein
MGGRDSGPRRDPEKIRRTVELGAKGFTLTAIGVRPRPAAVLGSAFTSPCPGQRDLSRGQPSAHLARSV